MYLFCCLELTSCRGGFREAAKPWRSHLLVSSAYVRQRSSVFRSMQRCRWRTYTVFGELLSQLLKIARSAVRGRPAQRRAAIPNPQWALAFLPGRNVVTGTLTSSEAAEPTWQSCGIHINGGIRDFLDMRPVDDVVTLVRGVKLGISVGGM
jgi:hypothetical protein